jgi:hypothetical protein
MPLIHDHEINPANASIKVEADQPSQGNASHVYRVFAQDGTCLGNLEFQNGPINAQVDDSGVGVGWRVNGVNGLTHEVLLAVILDRLRGFQSGQYACRENALAITKIEEALQWMHWRTRGRQVRGVEGTHDV